MDFIATIAPIWKVLSVGILLGAGLPAIFAIGMRLQSPAASDGAVSTAPTVGRRVAGIACFGVVVVAVLFGLAVLVGGDGVLNAIGLG
ncbi:hypothetical protein CLV47_10333 [Antricoccus suffuscus]|uniref:Uncharacterized protein n=1 Tax=Antricoccus suffuscus TaxID=1629062 RepID=A0A2T1A302_9ACTN|nr:hypothetical protein [Antricoccus suffuscus]PRZ42980.1 hypothetical protein CLV47_10333 [Antricoccus suffuscus]